MERAGTDLVLACPTVMNDTFTNTIKKISKKNTKCM